MGNPSPQLRRYNRSYRSLSVWDFPEEDVQPELYRSFRLASPYQSAINESHRGFVSRLPWLWRLWALQGCGSREAREPFARRAAAPDRLRPVELSHYRRA